MNGPLIDELLDFCRDHPVEKVDTERFLRHLSDLPQALVDLRAAGWLGVILSRAPDPAGATPFEWIGAGREALGPEMARRALAEIAAKARAMKLPGVHILMTPHWNGAEDVMRETGAAPLYHDLDMSHSDGKWGEDAPLPDRWRWTGFDEALALGYVDLLRRSFGSLPGFYMPAEEEVLRGVRETAPGVRILLDGDGSMRALTRCRIERRYIHAIARDPDYRGKGLGRLAMDEARRVLGPGPIALSTVRENRAAASLYERLGFKVTSELATWALPIGP